MQTFLEKHHKKLVVIVLAFMLVVSVLNANEDGAIFDETAHIPAGYSYVAERDMRLNPEHPPLIKDFSGLMLWPLGLKFDTSEPFWTTDVNGQWDAGRNLLWQEGNDADQIIFLSRLPIVLLSLILGLFIFKWTKELSGVTAGLFALVLYAFDPNILGHNHFVTTDIGIAAFMTFSFYYFLRFIREPSWKNVLWGGFFLGLLQLAKFSSITIFPIYGLVLIIYPLVKKSHLDRPRLVPKLKLIGEYLGKGLAAFIFSLIVVWGVYLVNIYEMPKEKLAETIEYYFPASDTAFNPRMVNKVSHSLNDNFLTRPLSEYFLGIAMVFKRVDGGNGAYFMQEVSSKAFPAYFPTVFILKEPLVSLFFMLLAVVLVFWPAVSFVFKKMRGKEIAFKFDLSNHIRKHITGLSLFGFVFLYSYISVTGNLNIGFRHLFPILPFVYILTSKVIFDSLKKMHWHARHIGQAVIIVLTVFLIAETVAAYPSYMSYFNPLAGGSKNGYRFVTDSNADWGQDIKRLKKWLDDYDNCAAQVCKNCCERLGGNARTLAGQGPIDKIHINYFGGGDIKYYFGDRAIDWWDSRRPIEPGIYAISTNYLQGSLYDKTKPDEESYRWIKKVRPFEQVGTSIFLYEITPEIASSVE